MHADRLGIEGNPLQATGWGAIEVPERITCVECGGDAHRLQGVPEDGFEAGDVVAFVCADCGHRHDVVVDAE